MSFVACRFQVLQRGGAQYERPNSSDGVRVYSLYHIRWRVSSTGKSMREVPLCISVLLCHIASPQSCNRDVRRILITRVGRAPCSHNCTPRSGYEWLDRNGRRTDAPTRCSRIDVGSQAVCFRHFVDRHVVTTYNLDHSTFDVRRHRAELGPNSHVFRSKALGAGQNMFCKNYTTLTMMRPGDSPHLLRIVMFLRVPPIVLVSRCCPRTAAAKPSLAKTKSFGLESDGHSLTLTL